MKCEEAIYEINNFRFHIYKDQSSWCLDVEEMIWEEFYSETEDEVLALGHYEASELYIELDYVTAMQIILSILAENSQGK